MTIPELRLLAYAPTRPMLRVVRLPDAVIEPAPVSLDNGPALDQCIRRDGWLVFRPNLDVWGVPLPFGGRPFRVAADTRMIASCSNPRAVWLRARGSFALAEYDGVARAVQREIELPDERLRVLSELTSGFLVQADDDLGLYVWEPPVSPRLLLPDVAGGSAVTDAYGRRVACHSLSTGELILLDLANGTETRVAMPSGSRRPVLPMAFSPDGAWLAIDLDWSGSERRESLTLPVGQLETSRCEPVPHRLAIVSCSDGALTIADGTYDNFANLVWSLDSEWILLTTPFAPRGLWLTRPESSSLEWISFGRRHVPSLLCDASDILH